MLTDADLAAEAETQGTLYRKASRHLSYARIRLQEEPDRWRLLGRLRGLRTIQATRYGQFVALLEELARRGHGSVAVNMHRTATDNAALAEHEGAWRA